MLQTRKSNPNKPPRIMIYGESGVGKSTFGAKSDNPVFIAPEGGSDLVTRSDGHPVDEMPNVRGWDDVVNAIASLTNETHQFNTLVIDSLDWLEGLAHSKIIGTSNKTMVTADGGYGSAYRRSQNMHQDLIRSLDLLRDKKNMAIVLIAHAHVKPVKDPEMLETYDQFEPKMHEQVSSLWREWVDAVLFARFATFIKTTEGSDKAKALTDGTRVLYTVKKPAFQAKNRYGLPEEMKFSENSWVEISAYTKKNAKDTTYEEIQELLKSMPESETKQKAIENVEKNKKDIVKLKKIKERINQLTKGN